MKMYTVQYEPNNWSTEVRQMTVVARSLGRAYDEAVAEMKRRTGYSNGDVVSITRLEKTVRVQR